MGGFIRATHFLSPITTNQGGPNFVAYKTQTL
jgi:hypothetical protein